MPAIEGGILGGLLIVLSVLAASPSVMADDGLFDQAAVLTTGAQGVEHVQAADLNGDGRLDLLPSANAASPLSWFENDGSLGFTQRSLSDDLELVRWLVPVDMDRDGDTDVLLLSGATDTVEWLENDGSGNFTARIIATGATEPRRVHAVDLDADGDLDVVATFPGNSLVVWYENDGNQNFSQRLIDDSAGFVSIFAPSDIDRDGDMDLLVYLDGGTDALVWYENDGSENFTATTIATGHSAEDMKVVDLDGDGDQDIVAVSRTIDSVLWHENEGSPNFTTHIIAADAGGVWTVDVGDPDADGDLDVLSGSNLTDSISEVAWHENDGNESFTKRVLGSGVGAGLTARYVDLDADGKRDVLYADHDSTALGWYQNNLPDRTYRNLDPVVVDDSPVFQVALSVADLDADGDRDIVTSTFGENGSVFWHENGEAPDGSPAYTTHTIATGLDFVAGVATTDLDADGDLDVVSAAGESDVLTWHENDGAQNFSDHVIDGSALGASSVEALDFDRDGDIDLVTGSFEGMLVWYENDGSQAFAKHVIDQTTTNSTIEMRVADVDGDGDMDVVSTSASDESVFWHENDGNQSFTRHTIDTALVEVFGIEAADFDRDGDLDVVVAQYGPDKVRWYRNDGAQQFTGAPVGDLTEAYVLAVSDLDQDGWTDVVATSIAGDPTLFRWFRNAGTGGWLETPDHPAGISGRAGRIAAVDIDGDGVDDIVHGHTNGMHWFPGDLLATVDRLDGDQVTILPGDGDVQLDQPPVARVVDTQESLDGWSLQVSMDTGAQPDSDHFFIDTSGPFSASAGVLLYNGTAIGQIEETTHTTPGGEVNTNVLRIIFDQAAGEATRARVGELVSALRYADRTPVGEQPAGGTVAFELTSADGEWTQTYEVLITVDLPPEFTAAGPYPVDENSAVGTIVGDIDANDGSGGDVDEGLSYSIVAGNTDSAFSIDPDGILTVANEATLDFETTPAFSLTVRADEGTQHTDTPVAIELVNVNEAPTLSDRSFQVDEAAPAGTLIGTLTASDPDAGDSLDYAVVAGDPEGIFELDAANGELRVNQAGELDATATPEIVLTVEATDSGGLVASASVTLQLLENPEPVFTASGPFTIDEGSALGAVVGDVDANDGSGAAADDGLTYSIVAGNTDSAFTIDADGILTVANEAPLDFEATPSFSLTVRADEGVQYVDVVVLIELADINEAPALASAGFEVIEGAAAGSLLGSLAATDPDAADTFSYTIVAGNPDGIFALDAGSGNLTLAAPELLDVSAVSEHVLTVQATDSGGLSDTAQVTVKVLAPRLFQDSFEAGASGR